MTERVETIFKSLMELFNLRSDAVNSVTITGQDPILPTPFLLGEAGAAVLATLGCLVSDAWALTHGEQQAVSIAVRDAAVAQRSHAYLKVLDNVTEPLWSPISGFYETRDQRWIQLHCNFPHHRQGVVDFFQCDDTREAVAAAVATCEAETLETQLSERGLCAAMIRTQAEWEVHPQAAATRDLPLLDVMRIGDSDPEPLPRGERPLSGIRVLDLTRVIAGPVCGKTLAEHGAEVTRIASPHLPFIPPLVMDTGFGKLSTFLDLDEEDERQKLLSCIQESDVFLQAYRPGALDEKGFSPERLAQHRPGIICVSLTAYSHLGPWAKRHGYDSLVQSASGIVDEQSAGGKPSHLPAQSLDYLTGFLAACGVMSALKQRAAVGGSYHVRVSLLQTANWLKRLGRTQDFSQCVIPSAEDIADLLMQSETPFGRLQHLGPVLTLSKTPGFWDKPSVPLGSSIGKS